MKKLTFAVLCCLLTGLSFGMNQSIDDLNNSIILSSSLNMSEEYFADAESLASSVNIQEDTYLNEYIEALPFGNVDTNNAVANDSNGNVTTMLMVANHEINEPHGWVFNGENVANYFGNNAMEEDSWSSSEDDLWYLIDESSSSSGDEVDFLSPSLTSSFEFM